jgi:hypothetical protein
MAMIELEHGLKQITYTNLTEDSNSSVQAIINEIIVNRTHQKIL